METAIKKEFERWKNKIGDHDPYADKKSLGIHEVLKAHFLIIDYFAKKEVTYGGIGPRDINLLHSALYRQHVGFDKKRKWRDNYEIISTLFYGLIKDHPFIDANKRTALLSLLFHLQKFKLYPTLRQKELEEFTILIAGGGYRKRKSFKEIKATKDQADVIYIANFLKRNSRKINLRKYQLTFRELNLILKSFGFELKNPGKGKTIEIYREIKFRKLKLFSGVEITLKLPFEKTEEKIAHVGFKTWGAEVPLSTLNDIRNITGLTARNGFDSETFYKGKDPIYCLIERYREPLQALADL